MAKEKRYYSGKFNPRNPQKYVGDASNIVYRSSWEAKVMSWLDKSTSIISWSSEELIIPYRSPLDLEKHRYFPDFVVRVKNNAGQLKTLVLEIKPKNQVDPPKPRKRLTRQYINEISTWGVNQAKWSAAKEFCLDQGWEFQVLTEFDLGIN